MANTLYNLYWKLLHELSFYQAEATQVNQIIVAILNLLDCPDCRIDALETYQTHDTTSPAQKVLDLHNRVNQKTAKTQTTWSLEQAAQLYRVPLAKLTESYFRWLYNVSSEASVNVAELQVVVNKIHGAFFPKATAIHLAALADKRLLQIFTYSKTVFPLVGLTPIPNNYNEFQKQFSLKPLVQSKAPLPAPKTSGCSSCQKKREAELLRQKELREKGQQPVRRQIPTVKPSAPKKPVAPQPVAPQPIASQPVAPQPIASQPVASQPVTVERAPDVSQVVSHTVASSQSIKPVTQIVPKSADLQPETRLMRRLKAINQKFKR